MPKSKYQCLVDATAPAGITLPPLKPGTDVSERYGAVELRPGRKDGLTGEQAIFEYETPTGETAYIRATEEANNKNESWKELSGGLRLGRNHWYAAVNKASGAETFYPSGAETFYKFDPP